MSLLVNIGIFFLNILFAIMKLCPVKKKITYISRQMDSMPLDFQMTIDQFKKDHPDYQHVVLAKMIHPGLGNKIKYCFHMLRQMYHIATSQAVVLDTYCIPVSILHQRKSLVVIQMWHALGSFKKFAYSILDQKEGSSSHIAKLMKMHYHYTYVLSSSEYAANHFAEAFHVKREQVKVFPLPKTDLLIDESRKKEIITHIEERYPLLKETKKKIIVYAPTFRKTDDHLKEATEALIHAIDFDHYELVIKLHPLTSFSIGDSRVIKDDDFTSLEFFHKADIIITDYSAVLFEALMLDKPLYFYDFDYDVYMSNRALYIDYKTQMPGVIAEDPEVLMQAIDDEDYDLEKIRAFKHLMIAPCKKSYTKDFTDFLFAEIEKRA